MQTSKCKSQIGTEKKIYTVKVRFSGIRFSVKSRYSGMVCCDGTFLLGNSVKLNLVEHFAHKIPLTTSKTRCFRTFLSTKLIFSSNFCKKIITIL